MNIYLQNETDFAHNGLGFLTDILNAKIEDNLNGDYSLFFEYKINGHLSEYLQNENIIKCKVSDGTKQLFIIKNVVKNFETIQVTCKHIFYQLIDNFLEDTAPTNLNGQQFLQWILDRTNFEHRFKAYSDISSLKSARYVRRNPVDAILGDSNNSMCNLFGGEIKRNNFDIHIDKKIGNDNGIKLLIGKNITGINITTNTSSVHTRIMPQGFDGLLLPEKYIDSPLIDNYPTPKIYKVEFNDIKYDPEDENAYHNISDAYNALRKATEALYENGIDKPIINVKIDWVELSKTNEYKNYSNLERVELGDTITIDLLGMTYQTRVIKTVYNVLTDKIETFELGTPKASLTSSTNNIKKKVEEINITSILEDAQNRATKLLTEALGGYVYKTQNELFIMDTNDPNTAKQIWRWNLNGLGFSSNGIDGPYKTAMTQDGQIVADFITTGKLSTSVIEGLDSLIQNVKESVHKVESSVEMFRVELETNNLVLSTDGSNKPYNTTSYDISYDVFFLGEKIASQPITEDIHSGITVTVNDNYIRFTVNKNVSIPNLDNKYTFKFKYVDKEENVYEINKSIIICLALQGSKGDIGPTGPIGPTGKETAVQSEEPPEDTTVMWLDTTTNQLKRWNGEEWEVINDFSGELDNINSSINNLSSSMQNQLNDLNTKISQVLTELESKYTQTNNAFDWRINTLMSEINSKTGELERQVLEQSEYMRFESGTGLVIGKSTSPYTLVSKEDGIEIRYNNIPISFWNGDTFKVTRLMLGNFAFTPRDNGSLDFGKVVN